MGKWLGNGGAAAPGEVVEWLMALVLKTSEVKASVGSNPTLSVSRRSQEIQGHPKTPAAQGS